MTATFNRISPYQNLSEDTSQVKVLWDERSVHSFIDPKLQYHNGEITIPETSIYSVYASVILSVNRTQRNRQRISLRVCRRAYDYEGTLLGETKLIPIGEGKLYTSLQVGGRLLLNKGDVLLVRVSSVRDLQQYSAGNTFVVIPVA